MSARSLHRLAAPLSALGIAFSAAAGCGYHEQLRLLAPPEPRAFEIAESLADVLQAAGFDVELVPGEGVDANLAAVQRGDAELAIVENSSPWADGVETLLPLSHNVLHILHRRGLSPRDIDDLLVDRRVYPGAPGSMGERLIRRIMELHNIPEDAVELMAEAELGEPDVVVLFAPISPSLAQRVSRHYEFFSVDTPEQIGHGSVMEGIALLYPQLEPFVIPAAVYGDATPEPVVTLSVSSLLVARSDIDSELAHDLVSHLVTHKAELGRSEPSLFAGIREDFDPNDLNFPLHQGARDFLERDHPGVLERYAELAGVSFSLLIALGSGLIAIGRRRDHVKKQRIDRYYTAVLRIQAESPGFSGPEAYSDAAERIRLLQTEAFEALIDEQVAADESFRIFIRLANDTIAELEREASTP